MSKKKLIKDLRPKKEKQQSVRSDGISRVTLSFYRYVHIEDLKNMHEVLFNRLFDLGCLGRIYIAGEGINAQVNVPKKHWELFDRFIQSIPEFEGTPYKIAVDETDTVSFYKLIVKIKDKIVADGLDDKSFDVTDTGKYLTAKEMNDYIDDPDAVVVDMRNGYESEIGHFEGAIMPDVDTFREELAIAPGLLKIHKNKKVALYCTGGIRCEKASAWLKHNGFKNVRHLEGGIIDYARQVESGSIENKFHGKNFVFDERMGEKVGNEIIAHCHLCQKEKCDKHTHCKNQACHVLFICCSKCLKKKKGYCSYKCMTFDTFPAVVKKRLTKNNHKKKLEQFKKNRMKSVVR